jgi:hypothetical protein
MLPDDIGMPEDTEFLASTVKQEEKDNEEGNMEEEEKRGLGAQIYIVPEKGVKKSSKNKEDTTLEKQHEFNPMEMGEVPEDILGGEEAHDLVPITSKMKKQTPKKKASTDRDGGNDSDDD